MLTLASAAMFGLGLLILSLLFKLFSWNVKALFKLMTNAVVGAAILLFINIAGSVFGFTIPINAWTSLIVGVAGVPGVIALAVWQLLF